MIYREEHRDNYTKISNDLIKNKNISLAAKGLLITMLSLPNDWSYSTIGLTSIVKESKNTIHRLLKELEENNFLIRNTIRNNKGRFVKCEYNIYELPYLNIRNMELPDMVISDNNKLLNNKDKYDKTLLSGYTQELIRRKYISENDFEINRYEELYNDLNKEYDYQLIYICTNYIIKRFIKNNNRDENNNPIKDKYNYLKTSLINNLNRLTDDVILWDFDD